MSASKAFYKAVYGSAHGIAEAFRWASGNKALAKRGLERDCHQIILVVGGMYLGLATGAVAAVALAPVVGPLMLAFAVATAASAGAVTPAALTAAYTIGKHENRPSR